MGIDSTQFNGQMDDKFHCLICTMVLEDPVQTPCDHIFCNECIKKWLSNNKSCPVDRRPLTIAGLNLPSRCFRNLLNNLEVKCDFDRNGCNTIVTLEHLKDHLTSCIYNPNSKVICDKGCNMIINRREYEMNNCFTHLSDRIRRHEKEINKQNRELFAQKLVINSQQEDNKKLTDEVSRLKDQTARLQDDVIGLQQTLKLNASQQQEGKPVNDISNFIITKILKWQKFHNMKVYTNQPNILKVDDKSTYAFAQSFYFLEPGNVCFKVKILKIGLCAIGLSSKRHPNSVAPGCFNGSIGYHNTGVLYVDKKREVIGTKFEVGAIIECGIKFPQNFVNDGNQNVIVYFFGNGQFITEKNITMPREGFFPTVYLDGTTNKVKYLTK